MCPGKDIHSLYIDGELSQEYKQRFEEHLQTCPACTQQQEIYLKMRQHVRTDATNYNQEDGYMRLMARLSYKTVVAPEKRFSFRSGFRRFAPVMAAALLFALFFPFNIFYSDTKNNQIINAVAPLGNLQSVSHNLAPLQQRGVAATGTADFVQTGYIQQRYIINVDVSKLSASDLFMPILEQDTVQIQIKEPYFAVLDVLISTENTDPEFINFVKFER